MRKLSILLFLCATSQLFADNVANGPPQLYQPTYIYGDTPMGVYMGDPYDETAGMGDDMYLPQGEGMAEHQTQSGEQEQSFQYIQGQEQLMEDHSKEALKAYQQQQVIGQDMEDKYQQQIDQQTHQAATQPITLPTM